MKFIISTQAFILAIIALNVCQATAEPLVLSNRLKNMDVKKMLRSVTDYLPKFDTGSFYMDSGLQGMAFVGVMTLAYGLYTAWYPLGMTTTTARSVGSAIGDNFISALETIEKFDIENLTGNYLDVRDHRCRKRIACEVRYNLGRYPTAKAIMQIILGINGKSARLVPSTLDECIHTFSGCSTTLSDALLRKTIQILGRK